MEKRADKEEAEERRRRYSIHTTMCVLHSTGLEKGEEEKREGLGEILIWLSPNCGGERLFLL